ncbi:nucleotidyltransferase domain-containing protein [candidate division KSB1 bacterium]|nr:nucleotidyltransferase domain-containing protein [candidate division KSB1 bacterium]NIR70750.1 nucleotidyltransferase domain-containing protein [candidate division KSB1 bacterium]NIS23203.1 nucleotidyltransferase domain-containing protein [candidate division KSB1 bacterium]NIT70063.1 nucleotidyltransferase domain-containing protein [candidate division KSB1 bacterium]NIU23700.1 nucleotidyltransferase domain-containing protein [candidate division KSB1 bacterium]
MDKNAVLDIVARFRNALESKGIRAEKIILYGSCAKNTQDEASDIDLVIISKDFRGKGYWERIDILSDAIYDVFEPIEAVALTPEEWQNEDTFVKQYASDGEVLFE